MPGMFDDVADKLFGMLLKGTVETTKFVAKAGYGAYTQAKENSMKSAEYSELVSSAELGNPEAQFTLGCKVLSETDDEVIADEALTLIEQSARQGNPQAIAFLKALSN